MSRWLSIAAAVIALDQATKFAVSDWLAGGRVVEVTSFFNFVLAHNAGAAFSFLAGAAGALAALSWLDLVTVTGMAVLGLWLAPDVLGGDQAVQQTLPCLGAAVFGDADKLKRLEAIVHPAVTRSIEEAFAKAAPGVPPKKVIVVPGRLVNVGV